MLNSTGKQTVGSGIAFAVVSTIAVALRLIANSITKKIWGKEDLFIVLALFGFYGHMSAAFWGAYAGGNEDVDFTSPNFNPAKEAVFLKSLFMISPLYIFTVTACKLSILFFYRRIFDVPAFKIQTLIVGAVCVAFFITLEVATLLLCVPFGAFWNPIKYPGAVCFNFNYFFVSVEAIELVIDTSILVLPIRQISKLQLSRRTKITLSSIFLLGGFVVITNIIRIRYTFVPHSEYIHFTKSNLWDHIHMGSAILCACLPTYRPLLKRIASLTASLRQSVGSAINNLRSTKGKHFRSTSTGVQGSNEASDPLGDSIQLRQMDSNRSPSRESPPYPESPVTPLYSVQDKKTMDLV